MSGDKDIEDIILERISSTKKRQSFLSKVAHNQEIHSQPLTPTSPIYLSQSPSSPRRPLPEFNPMLSIFMSSLGSMIDSKIAPLTSKLQSLEGRVDGCTSKMQVTLNQSAPPQAILDVSNKVVQLLEGVTNQAKQTIGDGINFYNNALKERESQFKQEHESTVRIVKETNRGLLETRVKGTMVNYQKIAKTLTKINEGVDANSNNLNQIAQQFKKTQQERKSQTKSKSLGSNLILGSEDADLDDDVYGELVEITEEELINYLCKNLQSYGDIMLGYDSYAKKPTTKKK